MFADCPSELPIGGTGGVESDAGGHGDTDGGVNEHVARSGDGSETAEKGSCEEGSDGGGVCDDVVGGRGGRVFVREYGEDAGDAVAGRRVEVLYCGGLGGVAGG